MKTENIISKRKNYSDLGLLIIILSPVLLFSTLNLKISFLPEIAVLTLIPLMFSVLMIAGMSFLLKGNAYTETLNNVENTFGVTVEKVIRGNFTSSENQTIIFTGVKNDEYSNFTAIVKDGIFTLNQHDPSNSVTLTPMNN